MTPEVYFEATHPRALIYFKILEALKHEAPFGFSRWNDGEFLALQNAPGANCDGHEYFPTLATELQAILARAKEEPPPYTLALGDLAITTVCELGYENLPWENACALMWGLEAECLQSFFEVLRGRAVGFIGPERLSPLSGKEGWEHVNVPLVNAWDELESFDPDDLPSQDIWLICAGMPACVVVDRIRMRFPMKTAIDCGSVFEPFVGINSRSYHTYLKMRPEVLTQ